MVNKTVVFPPKELAKVQLDNRLVSPQQASLLHSEQAIEFKLFMGFFVSVQIHHIVVWSSTCGVSTSLQQFSKVSSCKWTMVCWYNTNTFEYKLEQGHDDVDDDTSNNMLAAAVFFVSGRFVVCMISPWIYCSQLHQNNLLQHIN